jgi:hypothetical protein
MTEPITLTPRFITVLSRYFEANREDIVKKGLKFPSNDQWLDFFHYGKTNSIKVCFQAERNQHDPHCPEWDDEKINYIYENDCEECSIKEGITFNIEIELTGTHRTLDTIYFTEDEPIDETIKKIQALSGKTYEFCICNGIVFKDKLCKNCYPHAYTRSEEEGGDCSICYENSGRWCQFVECKHQFHYGCIIKSAGHPKKCPLCRNAGDYKLDPFDL